MSKTASVETSERELNTNELDQASGGKFHYVEMNGETWAVNGNGKPVQVTHTWSGPLGWLLN